MGDLTWKFEHGGSSNGSPWSSTYSAAIPDGANVVGFPDAVGDFLATGFAIKENKLRLYKHTTSAEGVADTFDVSGTVTLVRGEALIDTYVSSAAVSPSVETALGAGVQRAKWSPPMLTHSSAPLPGGKGQKKAIDAMVSLLRTECADVLALCSQVEVRYETRGGRGGWKAKVGHSRFAAVLGPLAMEWHATPATGTRSGTIKAVSDLEVIQHIGRGLHVVWERRRLHGDAFAVGDNVTIARTGQVLSSKPNELALA